MHDAALAMAGGWGISGSLILSKERFLARLCGSHLETRQDPNPFHLSSLSWASRQVFVLAEEEEQTQEERVINPST